MMLDLLKGNKKLFEYEQIKMLSQSYYLVKIYKQIIA
ncbi:MAG: hypothetical protein Q607_CBUC00212G0013 [Clostridium butyricum DORA_1]|nr:MAG: hypothetical protein Q607_CBUC00212G0013 [Clostridium butyricum DORA_1]